MAFAVKFWTGTLIALRLISSIAADPVSEAVNNRPVIGILAEKTDSKFGDEYIESAYVRYLELAGARVVPILGKRPNEYYEELFKNLNGVLFPGGGVKLTKGPYHFSGKIFFDLAKKAFNEGDIFPIWGTCLGFELLTVLVDDFNILNTTDSENLMLPLHFTKDFRKSRLFMNAPDEIVGYMSSEPVTQNNHKYSLTVETFRKVKNLNSFFRVISTNVDRKGKQFISTMEADKYPIYATQWHPEKNLFAWNPDLRVDHSAHAALVTQYMADFFVNEARKSSHRFPSEDDVAHAVIENYDRVFQPDFHKMESYYFNYTSVSEAEGEAEKTLKFVPFST